MSAAGRPARELLLVGLVALAAIAGTVPFSPGDSTPEWDNLVLAAVAAWATWRVARRLPVMTPAARGPWWALLASGVLFTAASLLTGLGLGGVFARSSLGDLLLILAVLGPIVTAARLAGRGQATRWPVLALDGVLVAVALVVVADVLLVAPALLPGAVDGDLVPLVIGYAGYPAVALGVVGALCTVTSRAVRRAANAVIGMTAFQALAAAMLAVLVIERGAVWVLVADVASVLALITAVLAVRLAPVDVPSPTSPDGRASITGAGLVVTCGALVGVPVTLVAALLVGLPLPGSAVAGSALLIALLLLRMVVRIRDTGRMSEDLVRSEADFRGLVEASSDGVAILDGDLRLVFTSPAARALLGVDPALDPNPLLLDLLHDEDRPRARAELTAEAGAPAVHLRVRPAGGDPRDLEVSHHERPGSSRRVLHLRDVTTRLRRERELERMAFTDHLTQLPNRAMLFQEMVALGAGSGERSLLVLDLDGFKAVNDNAGHEAGDTVLVEVARRLQGAVRAEDLVARLGGDEFAVLVAGDRDAGTETAQRIIDVLAHPHRLAVGTFPVGASVGLARLAPRGGQLAFRQADDALRAAKQAGKGCLRVWSTGPDAGLPVGGDLATALLDGQVQLRYNVATNAAGTVATLHALPVWDHPTAGLLPSADVWAAAGRRGHAADLQHWLLRRACADAAGLDEPLAVAVDLPAGHIVADALTTDVLGALAAAGMPATRLVLALTEEALLTSPASLPAALREVRAAGVRICLDDFGMGQTLFAHLSRVPLDSVRVDVGSLGARGDAARAVQIVSAIVASAETLGLTTVAHGVDPGPPLDAVLAAGATIVRSTAHPHLVAVADVPRAVAGLLRRQVSPERGPAGPAAGSILAR